MVGSPSSVGGWRGCRAAPRAPRQAGARNCSPALGEAADGIAEHAARAHVGQEERVVRARDRLERGAGACRRAPARPASIAEVSACPAWPIEPRSTGKSSLRREARRAPSSSRRGSSSTRARAPSQPRLPPWPLTITTSREPGAQAADDLARQLDQELRLERDGDAEPHVVRAQPRPHGGRDDDVRACERRRAQRRPSRRAASRCRPGGARRAARASRRAGGRWRRAAALAASAGTAHQPVSAQRPSAGSGARSRRRGHTCQHLSCTSVHQPAAADVQRRAGDVGRRGRRRGTRPPATPPRASPAGRAAPGRRAPAARRAGRSSRTIGVSTRPGATALTRIPCRRVRAREAARHRDDAALRRVVDDRAAEARPSTSPAS